MERLFQLEIFLRIAGISAASGLCLDGQRLYLISDNSTYLYAYHLEEGRLQRVPLDGKPAENIAKRTKPDFEAVTLHDGKIEIYASGSRDNRIDKVTVDTATMAVQSEDLTSLYQSLRRASGISPDEFNVEGVVHYNNATYFLQRGNGPECENGIFRIDSTSMSYKKIPLPSIGNTPSSFTEATVVDDFIYFIAAAEASSSTYLDGEIAGSLIGRINPESFKTEILGAIAGRHKFEGLTFLERSPGSVHFLLCEDSDTQTSETIIYKLAIPD